MFCSHCGQQILPNVAFCQNCGTPVIGKSVSSPITPVGSGYTVSSTGRRLANYVLDYIGCFIFIFAIAFVLALTGLADKINSTVLGLLLFFSYYLLFEGIWARTPAKFITKTKVVMHDGSKPDFMHILGRTLARIIPFEPFSFFAGPIGWHDSLSKTIVVPSHYTQAEVQQIDLSLAGKTKTSTVIIIVVSVFIGIFILGITSSVVLLALNSARVKSRDAKRIADAKQISDALALYYNDYSQYPASLGDLAPKYIDTLPTAPTPADGKCTDNQNQYQYQDIQGTNYAYTFCLGEAGEGYSDGTQVMTKDGIVAASSLGTGAEPIKKLPASSTQ